jgi:hypothetical protein
MTRSVVLVLALVLAACGGGDKPTLAPDAAIGPTTDAMIDAPPEQATFTSYVIDLITNGTTATAPPRPYAEFANLPDPDGANGSAYQSLF